MGNCYDKVGLYDPHFEHDACGVGFVADIHGRRSYDIISKAIHVLNNLSHRGASGSEANTGDGAGIMFQLPHEFFEKVSLSLGFRLPSFGSYGVGMFFFPQSRSSRESMISIIHSIVRDEKQIVLGWRDVPTNNALIGRTAKLKEPFIRQLFIKKSSDNLSDNDFRRILYVIRRRIENEIRNSLIIDKDMFYIPSFSHRTIVYKGMLTSAQLLEYYPDLLDSDMRSSLAIVHSRFSTNTFPDWSRAHPYRLLIHNGEINTLRGNVNWMRARQSLFTDEQFGDRISHILPVIDEDGSDSAIFDNSLEFLITSGYSLPHALMMMIPEPWEKDTSMDPNKRAFYEYHSCMMEPWDGPASIIATDGTKICAVLDRNGLRPSRYYITKDNMIVLASEVGVLEIPPDQILKKGRLKPGKMLMVDIESKKIVSDEELKHSISKSRPYKQWVDENLVRIDDIPLVSSSEQNLSHFDILLHQKVFGYTQEDISIIMHPMVKKGVEALGSMGTDTPLAVLSDRPQLLYNYFKQLFAQVTNPPIDAHREELVTSTFTQVGKSTSLLDQTPATCRKIILDTPILTTSDFEKLKNINYGEFKAVTISILFNVSEGALGVKKTLDTMFVAAKEAIQNGVDILILSDRNFTKDRAPIPALLAISSLHHFLIREELRTQAALILESGEPREVHHFCLLLGYGATAIYPYLTYETISDLISSGQLSGISVDKAINNYVKSSVKGIVKVLSKMGISTIKSYRGAQIFEAVGLHSKFIKRYFTGTTSRIEGIGLNEITSEALERHRRSYHEVEVDRTTLDSGGVYKWRSDSEEHIFDPLVIHLLQRATRENSKEIYNQYKTILNDQRTKLKTLRGLLKLNYAEAPIPLEEVESVEDIMRRFKTGAMSYGSISKEAHETLAIAMNRINAKSNTGEGGEDPKRYILESNGDSKNSAIKQVASGRFGVTSQYLVNARELQIKMAQGAKPGEGGQLPGSKVYPWIAKVRHSTPGVGLISPPPHHDIYSIEDLAELIHDLKNANNAARISVKLVSEVGVGTVAAGVAKGHADVILISGYDGGTGASPLTSIKHAGLPWELGLSETHQTLLLNDLRSRVVIEVDGKLMSGHDVAIAALLGAEEYGFATAPLVALGCLMMRVCHLNTCPVGVATQDENLRKYFSGRPEYLVHFFRFVAEELRVIMSRLGVRTINEMIGRTDLLSVRNVDHWKAKTLDLSSILYQPKVDASVGRYCQMRQDHGLENNLDQRELLSLCKNALDKKEPVAGHLIIHNTDRVVGTMLGSEVTRRYGSDGLSHDTIKIHFEGSAGQSFAAFLPKGITFTLEGDANDYFAKGLSGGKIIVYPPENSTFIPEKNIIIGNVALYGATSGEAYIRGISGERFCVRNSGVCAVIEGVGDHGCEYMTGGKVVVLGPTGKNFAAGMTGGVSYVLDTSGDFSKRCNKDMVSIENVIDENDISELKEMITKHVQFTNSTVGAKILSNWGLYLLKFVKVIPHDYKRMLECIKEVSAQGIPEEKVLMAAFELNAKSMARVGGN